MSDTQGSRVKEVRKYFKISQEELADKIGIRQSSVSQIEKDGSASAETLLKISSAYGINIGWLMEGDGEMLATNPPTELGPVFTAKELAEHTEKIVQRITDQHNIAMDELKRVLRVYEGIMKKNKILS